MSTRVLKPDNSAVWKHFRQRPVAFRFPAVRTPQNTHKLPREYQTGIDGELLPHDPRASVGVKLRQAARTVDKLARELRGEQTTDSLMRHRRLVPFRGNKPTAHADGWRLLAPSSVAIGNVIIGKDAAVWPNAVVRSLGAAVSIGEGAHLQERVVVNASADKGVFIGKEAIIEPQAVIEAGAEIGERAVIGSGAFIGAGAIVGAGAFVEPGSVVAAGEKIAAGQHWEAGKATPVSAEIAKEFDRHVTTLHKAAVQLEAETSKLAEESFDEYFTSAVQAIPWERTFFQGRRSFRVKPSLNASADFPNWEFF